VILIDAKLLIYAHISTFLQHERARAWLDECLNGVAPVGLPWPSILAFIRLTTNLRVFRLPDSVTDAWRQADAWLKSDRAWTPQPTERHAETLGQLLSAPGVHANLVPDAHLAALAIEHGLILCSSDGDFARFAGLRWENPLAAT